ncbi:methyl-accepting chemotaxis protein [Duganella sp. FT50W]|uniref:Methyl-accepting chemotaxis protein n=1 Tax=Duganella lactea TaxID=2692173 RepID=A0A6L8MFK1_9BURK|nr:methyl-accepting chemotaxis protein [Duganella lactea]MYM81663.1 methyl-accepting chemotaxis protein [Duganella lactea]
MDMSTAGLAPAAASKPLSGEVFSALINLSGRRRFTSQRIVLYALLASQGQDGGAATAQEALSLFRGAHKSLLSEADGLPGVFCPELREAYFGKLEGDKQIVAFADLGERTLSAIAQDSPQAAGLLAELVRITTPVLAILNTITSIYEEQAKRNARLMRKQLRGVITDIETINRQARMVAFNARIVAARAGQAGKEFSVVAGVLSNISGEIDEMVAAALSAAG